MPQTTSSVPAVLDALVAGLRDKGLAAFEQWPGPDAAAEMVVLGSIDWSEYAVSGIKTGRRHRQEEWAVGFELYVAGADGTTPADPKPARDRAFVLLGELEDLLADDPAAGTDYVTVQRVELKPLEAEPRVFERGWAYRVRGEFSVYSRLT